MTIPLPTGTVTFLFTDIEGSTPLAQQYPAELPALLARHHAILHQAIADHRGHVFQIVGDAFSAAFFTAGDALAASLNAQRALQHEAWNPAPIKVRMGLHTGAAQADAIEARAGGYAGYSTLAHTQRVMSVASGGQVLLSHATAELVRSELPVAVTLRDMGEHRLKGFAQPEQLWQIVAPDLATDFPPLKSLTTVPNNLPLQLTSFIGREKEIADVKGLLHSARLVTLTGSGGTGKTRLSQEIGAELLPAFANGVWLIELAPLSDAAQIVPALAQVFGLQALPFIPIANVVLDYLRDKTILLLLDNCEHLVEACARLANEYLHHCAGLKILASSREALGIAGEVAYRIPSLADAESTQLFVDRARAANAKFALTDANAPAIAQICRRLDGIPLAIELAAARVKLLTPEQIATRLDDMFRLLVGGSRTALPRQQTLRALIDWSYDLLCDEEKHLLQFASVFAGGWTLEALEFVADEPATLELLDQLVNKSLVVTEEHDGAMRYFMLETIRQYAREKLFDAKLAPAARDRHFDFYSELGEMLWERFRSADPLLLVQQANAELENFRAALEWGLDNRVEENVRLAADFCAVCMMAGSLTEGFATATAAIERARALPASTSAKADIRRQSWIARALFMKGNVGFGVSNMPEVIQALQEAIAISRNIGDKRMLGNSLGMYFTAAAFFHGPDSVEAAKESLKIFSEEVEDPFGLSMAYLNMARLPEGALEESARQAYFEKVQVMIREMPRSYQVGMMYLGMGLYKRLHGNYGEAKKIFREGLSLFEGFHNKNFKLVMMSELGHLERHEGQLPEAKSYYRITIKGWEDLGNRAALAHELECFGFLAIADEEPQTAAKLLGAAEALREMLTSPMTDEERVEYDEAVARLHLMLPEAEFNALWTEGKAMSMAQAIQFALS